jgi:hypothetical protein
VDTLSNHEFARLQAFLMKSRRRQMTTTIGQRILSAVIGHQLGISTDRALKLYVQGRELDPSYEKTGEILLQEYLRTRAPQAPADKMN